MRGNLVGVALATAVGFWAAGSAGAAENRNQTVLTEIRPETTDRTTRLTVEASGPLTYTYYSPDPLTLVIDIPETDATKVPAKMSVASPEVESVRVTSLARADGHSLARIEVRLASLSPYHIVARDNRLAVEFDRAAARGGPSQPAAAPAPDAQVSAATPTSGAATPVAQASATASTSTAATVAVPPPSGAASKRKPATTVKGITQQEENGQLAITIGADGVLSYEDFYLANPVRLVLDFSGVNAARQNVPVDKGAVKRVRLAQFSTGDPRVARMVVDLDRRTPYRIVDASDGVKILFEQTAIARPAASPEPLAAMRPVAEPAALTAAVVAPAQDADVTAAAPLLLPVPALAAEPPSGSAAFRARPVGVEEKKYTGAPISMNFKDGDLADIFRLFADISGLNIVVNPGISGKVTLVLTEVPWDQALDVILKVSGLGMRLEDNVVRIARLSDLQKEEADQRKLQEEAELAGDLVERLRAVSYARAKDLAEVLKKSGALSRRGTVHVDERTNTIILQDLPRFLNKQIDLINELDRATRQVEIEARVIVTSRNFSRDVGVQWGILNQQAPKYGTQTSLTFPNTITVGGRGTAAGTSAVGGSYVVNLPATAPATGVGVSLGNIIGSFNLDAALSAMEQQGRGRILSTPKITTQDNQEATIKQGLQFPIQVEMNNTITVQYKDATLTLKVTPQITEANTVILNLTLENNAADFTKTVGGAPSIQVQEAKTVLLVNDGDTAVVGGVYKSQEDSQSNTTPFLSRLPILGFLFRERSLQQSNQELLLFITPHIVKG
jgi:type IV pilus secretin PilQ/predicted competence protein